MVNPRLVICLLLSTAIGVGSGTTSASGASSGSGAASRTGSGSDSGATAGSVAGSAAGSTIADATGSTCAAATVGSSTAVSVGSSIEAGAGITNIAQIFERSATLQVAWADSGIEGPEDLAGKQVGSWGFGNEWELFAGLTEADATGYTIVQQNFDMNALLNKEIDAAQAMTYNEYAQLLEATNPETGELYQPEDFSVIDWNEVGTAMLQDAIWANSDRLADDPEYAETAVKLIQGAILGWIDQRDDPQAAADAVTAAGSTLGTSHQLWMTNEINKLIWPSTSGIGHINEEQWDATVEMALATKNQDGAQVITTDPPDTAYTNEYVDEAIANLEADGVDVLGESYEPIEVTLNEGGN